MSGQDTVEEMVDWSIINPITSTDLSERRVGVVTKVEDIQSYKKQIGK